MLKLKKVNLLEGPVGKTIIRLALPMLFGMLGMVAFNLADTYFVGMLGERELAAMGFTLPVAMVVHSIAMGLGIGTSAVVSRAIGQGNHHKVQRLTTDALLLSFALVVIFCLAGLIFMDPLFRLLGAKADLLPLIKSYMTIWFIGVPFVVIPMVGNNAIRATGDTKTPAVIMMVAIIANLILDPLLIFGWGPIPRMELTGAALATLLSRAITMSAAIWILGKREKMITLERVPFREVLASWKKVGYIGGAAALTNLVMPVSLGVITRLVAGYGESAVAAFGVSGRIEMFAIIPVFAVGAVLTPFIGQNWGAGKPKRVLSSIKFANLVSLAWCGLVFVALIFFARPLASVFNDSPRVIELITRYLWIVGISYGFQGILRLSGSAFNALHKPIPAAILSILRMVVLYIPLALLGSELFQLDGIYGAATISNIVAGGIAVLWLRHSIKNDKSMSLAPSQPVKEVE